MAECSHLDAVELLDLPDPVEIGQELGAARAVEILAGLEAEKGAAYAPAPLLRRGQL